MQDVHAVIVGTYTSDAVFKLYANLADAEAERDRLKAVLAEYPVLGTVEINVRSFMLHGSPGARFEVYFVKPHVNRLIPAIKAVRSATQLGLKAAKDLVEHARDGYGPMLLGSYTPHETERIRAELTGAGCTFNVVQIVE